MGKKKSSTKNSAKAKEETVIFPQPKEQAGSLFPRIYRFITERWKLIASSFVSGLIIIAIIIQSISLYSNFQAEKKLRAERGQVEKEIVFWKDSLTQYPNHRDIYFRLASLEYRLGNTESARENLKKALELDPNFEKGREMEKQINL